jgi:NTP pyrophosphatase (non-canonical NTP hydrolase)
MGGNMTTAIELHRLTNGTDALTFGRLQSEVREWSVRNFGDKATHQPLLGAMEELGELCHAHLKQEQGIRGTAAEHEAAARDAIGDIVVYLADYVGCRGWDFQAIMEEVWGQVRQRDWRRNSLDGSAPGPPDPGPDADRRRLDWLEEFAYQVRYDPFAKPPRWEVDSADLPEVVFGLTLRAAVDAAMAEWAAKGGPPR